LSFRGRKGERERERERGRGECKAGACDEETERIRQTEGDRKKMVDEEVEKREREILESETEKSF
jgi:hypothetical protein